MNIQNSVHLRLGLLAPELRNTQDTDMRWDSLFVSVPRESRSRTVSLREVCLRQVEKRHDWGYRRSYIGRVLEHSIRREEKGVFMGCYRCILDSRITDECLRALVLNLGDGHLYRVRFNIQVGGARWPRIPKERVNWVDLSDRSVAFRRNCMRYDVGRDSDVFEKEGRFYCVIFEMKDKMGQ